MTLYDLLTAPYGPLLSVLFLAVFTAHLYNAVTAVALGVPKRLLIPCVVVTALLLPFLFFLLSSIINFHKHPLPISLRIFQTLRAPECLAALGVLTVFAAAYMIRLFRWRATRITPLSIKDSIDSLPAGIVIGDPLGAPVMVNLAMEHICVRLTGQPLRNTRRFWQTLTENSLPGSDDPLVRMPDGAVLSFRRNAITKDNVAYEQITSSDVTELYALTLSLREKNEDLNAMKRRLLRYSEDVARVTRDQEILAAKIAVHDDVGHALLSSAYYLEHPGDTDAASVLSIWRSTVSVLSCGAAQEREADAADALILAARSVGVEVDVQGTVPEENPARNLTINALHECITNTLKHTDGDRITIVIKEAPDAYIVSIRNNGRPPDGPIRETGGLRLLRQMTESSGGTMTVRIEPAFTLIITAPKGGEP